MTLALLLLAASGVPSDELDAHLRQAEMDRKSCGPRAAWHCLRRFGRDVSFDDVSRDVGHTEKGTRLDDLVAGLRKNGLPARAVVCEPAQLAELPVPSILVIDDSHCIVYEGFEADGKTVRYYEPAHRQYKTASAGAFLRDWSGKAIVFEEPQLSPVWFAALAAVAAAGTCLSCALAAGLWRSWAAPRRAAPPPNEAEPCASDGTGVP